MDARVVLVDEGEEVEYRSHRTHRLRTAKVGRRSEVYLDDVLVGEVEYRMIERESRSEGRRYVNSRWRSPGWVYRPAGSHRWFEGYSRRESVDQLVRGRR